MTFCVDWFIKLLTQTNLFYFTDSEKKEAKQHLDSFLSKNTSEDNASFVEILEENEKKHREKHAWLFENEESRTEVL